MRTVSYPEIRKLLEDLGPMTSSEVHALLPGTRLLHVSSAINRMRRFATKLVYIERWVRESDAGGRRYLRAVYALGDRRCARRPPSKSEAQRSRERRAHERERKQAHKALLQRVPNSVFALASVVTP